MRLAASFACFILLFATACRRQNVTTVSPTAGLLHLTMPGRTVHNSHYLSQSFLYQLQTVLGTDAASPKVLDGRIVTRHGKEFYLDLSHVPADKAAIFQQIAARQPPADGMSMDELEAYMLENYYKVTKPYPNLKALLRENPYRDNPNWLVVPVDSVTFRRRRVLHLNKDRIADALVAFFGNNDRLIFLEGTIIAAESFDKQGHFVEAEVLRKRADTFWNFSIYGANGALIPKSVAFDEDGNVAPERDGFHVPRACAMCHRMDRLDFSGEAGAPVLAPVRSFFQDLPARVPQIHLGPEYYDHMAFTELTEASGKVKDGVFGVYGSLLLSELAGRKRLGTLTDDDKARYRRLAPYFPELLQPLDRVESLTNSIGMKLIRIPAPHPNSKIGAPLTDPDRRPDEQRHAIRFHQGFFLGVFDVTNAQFRRFRPSHHSAPFRGVAIDGDEQPVVDVSYQDAQDFIAWLNQLPAERAAGRTYRLPSEEEWEYAVQGYDSADYRRFPWGDQWPPPDGSGNFADEANGARFHWEFLHGYRDPYIGTAPVGRFFPNPFFLYDMAGNVYQWTSSSYEQYPGAPEAAAPGQKPYGTELRVVRGSSWADELPKVMRCAFRNPMPPETKTPFLGFRVAADIPSLR